MATIVSHSVLETIRYDTRCYFYVRSKADVSQLNLAYRTSSFLNRSHRGCTFLPTPVRPGRGNCRNLRRNNGGCVGRIGSSWPNIVVNSELGRQSQSAYACWGQRIILFTSGSCSLTQYTKLCMVWQPNIRNML